MTGFRDRLGLVRRDEPEGLPERVDPAVMARSLMYLLAAVGGMILVSTAVPGAPLEGAREVPVLTAIAFTAALGLFVGFDRLPPWGYHALLLSGTALVSWAIHADGDGRSPYALLYVWLVIYAALFFGRIQTAAHVTAVLAAYGGVVIARRSGTDDPALQWAMLASAVVLSAAFIQALNSRLDRLVNRLQAGGRTDTLTGLYNADAFADLLETEIERARRSGNRLAVVLAELDSVQVGPRPAPAHARLLAGVGAAFRESPRQIDVAARIEGGRFAVVLPYTDEHGGQIMAERLRRTLASADGGPRASIGIASFPRHGAGSDPVMRAAEEALGEARDAGGDRVIVYQPPRGSIQRRSASVTVDEESSPRGS